MLRRVRACLAPAVQIGRARSNALEVDSMPGADSARGRSGARGLVLLAEDDEELRSLLATVLRKDGHEVVEATTGTHLLRYIEGLTREGNASRLPDVLVSDVKMPGLTGLEVAAALRIANWGVPIVLITAFGDEEAHQRASELGAVMLDKPFDLDTLRGAVREALTTRHERPTGTG
jgi:DNA-binding response OmpR family regulator